MGRKEEILEFCKKENRKLTAMDIINALYPGKPQPYINSQITQLVYEKKLIREDTKPYTVHVPSDGEIIGEISNYSRGSREKRRVDVPVPCVEEVEKYLKAWDDLENYTLQERALNKLFFDTYPYDEEPR